MRKGLSALLLMLILTVSLSVVANAANTTDQDVVFHVHQMDTDYSSTGIGVWDGTTWNDYADVVTENDAFGGVITKTYTAAAYELVNNKTNVEFKPSRDVSVTSNEPKDVLLAPGDGKVFADISALDSETVNSVDLYFVEGSTKIFMGEAGFSPLIVVFGDPHVVQDDTVYDTVVPTATGNGTGGSVSALFNYVYEGALFDIDAKIFMVNVAADAGADTTLSVGGKDYTISNTTLVGGEGQVIFVEMGADNYATSGETWGAEFELNYQLLAGNKFQPSSIITNPTQINAEFLIGKNVGSLTPDRFMVTDGDDNEIAIESITHPYSNMMGTYTQTVTPAVGESYFTLFVKTNLDYTKIGLVGALQGWNPDNAVTASGLDSLGNAVFEVAVASDSTSGGYKLLYDEADDGFAWSDYQITTSDQPYDFAGEPSLVHYVDAQIILVGDFVATKTAGEGEKMLTVHVELSTPRDYLKLGIVGDLNGWSDAGAIVASGVDSKGYVVFEVPTTSNAGGYKILYDENDNGFAWGDPEVTPNNMGYDFGEGSAIQQYLSEATQSIVVLGAPINTMSPVVKTFTINFDEEDMLSYGEAYIVSFTEVIDPEEVIASVVLPFNLSHELVEGDFVDETGTLALSPMDIQIMVNNRMNLIVELFDVDASEVIAFDVYEYDVPMGTYTYTVTPGEGEHLIRLHLAMTNTTIAALNQLGLVGSVQGWNPDNAINPTGMDSEGNYVFEVTTTDMTGEIKILFDADGVFNWGDAEVTPGNVAITLDGGTYLVQEGATSTGTMHQMAMLSSENALSPDGHYQLQFTDKNGFAYFQDLLIDSQAPTITAPRKPNVDLIIDEDATFNVSDFFTSISVVDNADGEIDYTITSAIDTSVLGEQTFTIEATDSWGNTTSMSWDFVVGHGPIITLTTDEVSLTVGDSLPNWSSYVSVDRGTISINADQVDVTTPGTYYVIITATDSTGSNQESITVTVTAAEVVDTGCNTGCGSELVFGQTAIIISVILTSLVGLAALLLKKKY